jgi:ribosomal protein S18 acetylase RimI-like enzyme
MECGPLLDLRADLDTSEFRALLLLLVGWRHVPELDEQRLDKAIQYYRSQSELRVLGFKPAGVLEAIIAIEIRRPHEGAIQHIVVQPKARHHGMGRELVAQSRAQLELSTLTAETDRNAVGFYERSGFRVTSLGEKYPGVERFSCTWTALQRGAEEQRDERPV